MTKAVCHVDSTWIINSRATCFTRGLISLYNYQRGGQLNSRNELDRKHSRNRRIIVVAPGNRWIRAQDKSIPRYLTRWVPFVVNSSSLRAISSNNFCARTTSSVLVACCALNTVWNRYARRYLKMVYQVWSIVLPVDLRYTERVIVVAPSLPSNFLHGNWRLIQCW